MPRRGEEPIPLENHVVILNRRTILFIILNIICFKNCQSIIVVSDLIWQSSEIYAAANP